MKELLRNWLYQSRLAFFVFTLTSAMHAVGQVSNYVSNGGFENIIVGSSPPKPKYWSAFDTVPPKAFGAIMTSNLPPFNAPQSGYTFQWPRHGGNLLATTFYCPTCVSNPRGYPRNRLKQNLQSGQTYCFTMFLNLTNTSTYAIDEIGVYFSDSSNDTIQYCNTPITYLTPQLKTASNIYVSDTLNWVEYHGLYAANGDEIYVVIGNFRDNPNTDTLFVGPTDASPEILAVYCLDDISLINIDLPAFAGNDTTVYPGSSVYLGRESDIGLDEACVWYKLPDITNPIDTIAGFWINPISTSTYVVKQQLTCNNSPKYDSVVVQTDVNVGNREMSLFREKLEVFPNPANEYFELRFKNQTLRNSTLQVSITNNLGQIINELQLEVKEGKAIITTTELSSGVYLIHIKNSLGESIAKKLTISR